MENNPIIPEQQPNNLRPEEQQPKKSRLLSLAVIIFIIAILGLGGYVVYQYYPQYFSPHSENRAVEESELREYMEEVLIKSNPDIMDKEKYLGLEYYKTFEQIKSPYNDKIAVLFGLDIEKNPECCLSPFGLFIIDGDKLVDEYKILEGALQYIYLDNVVWEDENKLSYDLITSGEFDKKSEKKYLVVIGKDISDWEQYQSNKYGFRLKYPLTWSVTEEQNSFTKEDFLIFSDYNPGTKTKSISDMSFLVKIFSKDNKNIYSEYQSAKNKREKFFPNKEEYQVGDNSKIELYTTDPKQELPILYAEGFVEDDNFAYIFYISESKSFEIQEGKIDILRRVLESFEFYDEEDISDWQIYLNERYGFQIEYPNDWMSVIYRSLFFPSNSYYIDFRKEDDRPRPEITIGVNPGGWPRESLWQVRSKGVLNNNGYEVERIRFKSRTQGVESCSKDGIEGIHLSLKPSNEREIKVIGVTCADETNYIRAISKALSTLNILNTDELAAWHTYQNKEFGFSIRIPSFWTRVRIQKEQSAGVAGIINFEFQPEKEAFKGENSFPYSFSVFVYANNQFNNLSPERKNDLISENNQYKFVKYIESDVPEDLQSGRGSSESFYSTFKIVD